MMNFNNHDRDGFTLIEVLISLAIMAIILTTIFVALSQAVTIVATRSDRLKLMLRAKQFLCEVTAGMHDVKKKTAEKKFEDPSSLCVYREAKVNKDSALALLADVIKIVHVTATAHAGKRLTETIAVVMFVPQEPQKKETPQKNAAPAKEKRP